MPSTTISVSGQEAVRISQAGEAAEEDAHKAILAEYYNLRVGPTLWRFEPGLGFDYNDNVILEGLHQEGDFIFRPQLDTQLLWPISEKQSLNLNLRASYWTYAEHSTLNHAAISPNSGFSVDIHVGDCKVNLHDRFSITENNYQDPTVAGGGYSSLQNATGVDTLWDLNRLLAEGGYDHSTYIELTGGQGVPNRSSDIFCGSLAYQIKPEMLLGLELGGGFLHSRAAVGYIPYTEAIEWNVGSFFRAQVSEHLEAKVSLGYAANTPDAQGALSTAEDFRGFYSTLDITHHLNKFLDYTLSGGHHLDSSLAGGSVDLYMTDLSLKWRIFQKTALATSFQYYHGSQVFVGGETFDQYGPQASLNRKMTKNLTGTLMYQFYQRSSDVPGREYTVNIISLDLMYQF
jgi:hypothetical protein